MGPSKPIPMYAYSNTSAALTMEYTGFEPAPEYFSSICAFTGMLGNQRKYALFQILVI